MSPYGTFTPEEWAMVKAAPMLAANLVAAADPSGPMGMMKEVMAASKVVAAKDGPAADNPLVSTIMVEWEDLAKQAQETKTSPMDLAKSQMPEMPKFNNAAEMNAWAVENLSSTISTVDAKAGADAAGYKQWVWDAALASANAAKEGSFLGFGGAVVSASEQAALDQIKAILGL
jgi:hypothetical protein